MFGTIAGFVKGTKRLPIIEDPNDEDFWEKVDINLMTRLEMKIALDSRGMYAHVHKCKHLHVHIDTHMYAHVLICTH
jgi:hypothetical protein